MKILLVISSYLPNIGGLQSVTSSLAEELAQRGHQVSIITHRYPRTFPASETIHGIPVTRWFFLVPRWMLLQNKRLDLFLAAIFYFPLTFVRLVSRIVQSKPDVVNLHFVGAPALFLLFARRLMRFRLIVSLHGDDVEGMPARNRFDRWIFCAIVRRADVVTACSNYLVERARQIEPRMAQAFAIHNGIQMAQKDSSQQSGDFILGVGRFVPSKGFDILLRAMAESSAGHLKLVGDGPERGALEWLRRELGLNGQVDFLGAQSRADTFTLMQKCRLIVVPSRADSFGLVALEAMAAGKPIIATRVGGLPEILQGADAILIEPENPIALANGIRDALTRLEREPGFGARNREHAARFSIVQMRDAYAKVYAGE